MGDRFVRTEYDYDKSKVLKVPVNDPKVFRRISALAIKDLEIVDADYHVDEETQTIIFYFLVASDIKTTGGPVE